MKAVIQRVNYAKVSIGQKEVSEIGKGILIFIGISNKYNDDKLEWMVRKVQNIRLWPSENKGFDLSVKDIGGEILVVSQFTLYGIVEGNKPNFKNSAEYSTAKQIYDKFVYRLKDDGIRIKTGEFGAMMNVELDNDGPVTIILEK